MNRLGQMLKLHRTINNIEQQVLADEIGIGKSTLSRIEKGGLPDVQGGIKIMAWLFQQEPTAQISQPLGD